MKLYRLTARNKLGMFRSHVTRFSTSIVGAKKLAQDYDIAVVTRVTLPDRITAQDWIDLLESDAPGNQKMKRTPVDFIGAPVLVWSKGVSAEALDVYTPSGS